MWFCFVFGRLLRSWGGSNKRLSIIHFLSTMASSATSVIGKASIVPDCFTEIVNLLLKDQQLQDLLDKSFKSLQSKKVTRNLRRALRSFSQDMLLEAETPLQERFVSYRFVLCLRKQVQTHLAPALRSCMSFYLYFLYTFTIAT